jgi:hypothetical protein
LGICGGVWMGVRGGAIFWGDAAHHRATRRCRCCAPPSAPCGSRWRGSDVAPLHSGFARWAGTGRRGIALGIGDFAGEFFYSECQKEFPDSAEFWAPDPFAIDFVYLRFAPVRENCATGRRPRPRRGNDFRQMLLGNGLENPFSVGSGAPRWLAPGGTFSTNPTMWGRAGLLRRDADRRDFGDGAVAGLSGGEGGVRVK